MTEFCKYWIGATCAPESILIVKESNIGALLSIKNESGTKTVRIIEDKVNGKIIGLGYTYAECCTPVSYSFREAIGFISEKLDLYIVNIPDHR